jgi:hypothetical protein
MEELVKQMGFGSLEEYHRLVANVDLSTLEKLNAFNEWKNEDGTKEGILKLPTLIIS